MNRKQKHSRATKIALLLFSVSALLGVTNTQIRLGQLLLAAIFLMGSIALLAAIAVDEHRYPLPDEPDTEMVPKESEFGQGHVRRIDQTRPVTHLDDRRKRSAV